ncbi:LysR family transcriptional regulator [Bacillus niameyensis]|uniref:LysR family transcriptional regulator n=1 Tax=Bacillus niameyensis TaxID=1522308 RepID=UPI0007858BAE|nr:LysR family transcriptional regulator [Bacillus niameyensis]
MEWQQLEYFQTVAEVQHFTRAAEMLSISQPALSRSIAKLEAELGVPLFDRQGRSVRLNRFGERFQIRVNRALKEIQDGKEELKHRLHPDYGVVALSFLKSLGISVVPKMLNEFIQEAPQIRFQLYQQATKVMLDQLENGEIDFALSSMTESRTMIQWQYLWEEEIFVYVPSNHRLAKKGEVQIRELEGEGFIAIKEGYGLRTISDRLFQQAGVTPNILFEGDEVVTILGFINAGLGISLLPDISKLDQSNIVRLRIIDSGSRRKIGLAWKAGAYLSPPAERFRTFLYEKYMKDKES